MSELGEGLPVRKELPKKLFRKQFIVALDMKSDDEGLDEENKLTTTDNDEDIKLEIIYKSDDCELSIGDEVMMNPRDFMQPRSAFRIGDKAYYVYDENNVIGIW